MRTTGYGRRRSLIASSAIRCRFAENMAFSGIKSAPARQAESSLECLVEAFSSVRLDALKPQIQCASFRLDIFGAVGVTRIIGIN